MAQSIHTQKKRTSPGRITGGVIFLILAFATFGLVVLVCILYISKQNSLPWTLNAVLLFILGLVFFAISLILFVPASTLPTYDNHHCPNCGDDLLRRRTLTTFCPNLQCRKILGPEDWDDCFCRACGTEISQTINQITGHLPVFKKRSTP
jgi:hypothetical protein